MHGETVKKKKENHKKCLITSRSVLLRMRNVADKSCRGNQNTYFVFNNFLFPKTATIMR